MFYCSVIKVLCAALSESAWLFYQTVFRLSRTFLKFFSSLTSLQSSFVILPRLSSFVKNFFHLFKAFFDRFYNKRRRRDLNPRAAVNDLLPFQGSPFGQLGYFSKLPYAFLLRYGEGGIRTHAPLRTNGFQDRLVMTTSIPLHLLLLHCLCQCKKYTTINHHFCQYDFFKFFYFS